MNWTIPGTVLEIPRENAAFVQEQFHSLFLGGGMVLSQVTAVSGLEAHTVQNWVRRGFLPPPVQKRYQLGQLCRILTINSLKSVLPLEKICSLLRYINGQLSDGSDDLIDDAQLYFMFVRLASKAQQLLQDEDREQLLTQELSAYKEPVPGARQRVENTLRIMLTAYLAARLSQQAGTMLNNIEKE